MIKKEVYMQQGDVVLYKEKCVPKTATPVEVTGTEFVVEKGEGIHTHQICHPQLQQVLKVSETKDRIYLEIEQELELVHEEHGTSQLEKGMFLSKIKEREYDYETEEVRETMD